MEAWPTSLPIFRTNQTAEPNNNVLRTEMAGGIARQRQQYTARTYQVSGTLKFDDKERWLFEGWVQHRLAGGAAWFTTDMAFGGDDADPFLKSVTARIVKGAYKVAFVDDTMWQISATLEVKDPPIMTAAQADVEYPV